MLFYALSEACHGELTAWAHYAGPLHPDKCILPFPLSLLLAEPTDHAMKACTATHPAQARTSSTVSTKAWRSSCTPIFRLLRRPICFTMMYHAEHNAYV